MALAWDMPSEFACDHPHPYEQAAIVRRFRESIFAPVPKPVSMGNGIEDPACAAQEGGARMGELSLRPMT